VRHREERSREVRGRWLVVGRGKVSDFLYHGMAEGLGDRVGSVRTEGEWPAREGARHDGKHASSLHNSEARGNPSP
jgi:hypothetical protein